MKPRILPPGEIVPPSMILPPGNVEVRIYGLPFWYWHVASCVVAVVAGVVIQIYFR